MTMSSVFLNYFKFIRRSSVIVPRPWSWKGEVIRIIPTHTLPMDDD